MGKDFVTKLVSGEEASRPVVYVINRGKSHWNDEVFKLKDRLHFYYGDRDVHIEYAKLLKYLTTKASKATGLGENFKWDLVVDFCGYLRKEVKSSIRGLAHRLKLYVFISTDSVYDVSDTAGLSTPVKEEESIRPSSNAEIMKKAEDEDYGHDKLKCEEYLHSHCANPVEGFPYVCLRLPDVFGPYDATGRWWAYLFWLQKMNEWPIHSKHESRTKKLSFVFSEDVTSLLISFIIRVNEASFIRTVHAQSYNIAFDKNPTLDELVQMMADSVKAGKVNFIDERELAEKYKAKGAIKGKYFYPSVYCPHLDTTKAKRDLSFKPIPLAEAIRKTSQFFVGAGGYASELKKAYSKFSKVSEIYE
jgi:nucleoside-diphosphate-sugar epimerase